MFSLVRRLFADAPTSDCSPWNFVYQTHFSYSGVRLAMLAAGPGFREPFTETIGLRVQPQH